MIVARTGAYGLSDLLRLHGSAAYKVLVPVLISSGCMAIYYAASGGFHAEDQSQFKQPYAIEAMMVFFSFLLTSRLNYSVDRYWNATGACFHMQSKLLDCAMDIAAFHYQSLHYADCRPCTFGENPTNKADGLVDHGQGPQQFSLKQRRNSRRISLWRGKGKGYFAPQMTPDDVTYESKLNFIAKSLHINRTSDMLILPPETSGQSSAPDNVFPGQPLPSPFLQQSAHLLSLLSAVGYSTLRSEVENIEVPVQKFYPGAPWPPSDPDQLDREDQHIYSHKHPFGRYIRFILGQSRSPRKITLYHAARPLRVMGGVSDQEMQALYNARGSHAKVTLITMWLQEFLNREILNGSTGKVGAPILSNLFAFISEYTDGYNVARKISCVPFPFPHAQLTAVFCFGIMVMLPVLYMTYVTQVWLAFALNAATVSCLLGIHEVSRELEIPFTNAPNELPLTTWQAHFNEALLSMFAGYHPDYRATVLPALVDISDADE